MRTTPPASLALRSSQVGRVLGTLDVEVTFRRSAAYAAAIRAGRDCYLDDRHQGGAVAPPCLITVLEWPLVGGTAHLAALGVPEDELFGRLLHAFQDTRWHRAIRIGDRLRIEATLASVEQRTAGALAVLNLVTREQPSGRIVAESWFGAFFRDATADQPRGALPIPVIDNPAMDTAIDPGASGTGPAGDIVTFGRTDAHIYAECAGLWNPIHTEPGFAAATGLPDVALHGTLLWAIAGERIIDRHLSGDPTRLARLAARFRRPILPGRALALRDAPLARPGAHAIDARQTSDGALVLTGVAEILAGHARAG